MNNNELCSICGEGHVTNRTDQVEREHLGTKTIAPLHYKNRDACGSDFAGAEECLLNKDRVFGWTLRHKSDAAQKGLFGQTDVPVRSIYFSKDDAVKAAKEFSPGTIALVELSGKEIPLHT